MEALQRSRPVTLRPDVAGVAGRAQPGRGMPWSAVIRPLLLAVAAAGLAAGALAWAAGQGQWASTIWSAATLPVLAALLFEIVASLRRGDVGLDVVAALSMTGALSFGEALAAVVVALMYAGGQYLEDFAERRATRSLSGLLSRVPRSAILDRHGELSEVALDRIVPGDRLLIRRGDVVPVDGTADGLAVLDESALTGESLPVRRSAGESVMSGVTNVGDAFHLDATRPAAESTFAGIVRLVEAAQRAKAPMARLADRFSVVFLALTVAIAGTAWLLTGDPIRGLAVLVIATPCPLILAVPVAVVSGLSRAATAGILVKGGKALEALARIRVLVIDKTGTLTHGRARIAAIEPRAAWPESEVLRLAASLDQASSHVMARAIVTEARESGVALSAPADVTEVPGEGIEGTVEGHRVAVGGDAFVRSRVAPGASEGAPRRGRPGTVTVAVGIDGVLAGTLVLSDSLRPGARGLVAALRALAIRRIVLASGDRRDVAEAVAGGLGLDAVYGELSPDLKIEVVRNERSHGPVMMIGDGVNDAPALAAADLGVAMGANGAQASAEAADVVLLVDDLSRIVTAIRIARRSQRIALQSVAAGIGLSVAGMLVASAGYLTPVEGALIQEAIDVAVILNALRALTGDPEDRGFGPAQARSTE